MYSVLRLTKQYNDKKEFVSCFVEKLTGIPMFGYVNRVYLRQYKFTFKDVGYIIINDDLPPHYCVAFRPLKNVIQFDDDWKLLSFLRLSNPFSRYLLSAVYDKEKLSDMDCVLNFLHDLGERLNRSPKAVKQLPL